MHLLVALALLALTILAAPAAFAADATLSSFGAGLYNTVRGRAGTGTSRTYGFVGAVQIKIDGGAKTDAYCVDLRNGISIGDSEPQVRPDYPCEVLYILKNAFPGPSNIHGRLADDNREAAAVQAAIWYFTDAFTMSSPSDVASRAAKIVDSARSECRCETLPAVPHTLTLSPPSATNYLPVDTSHTVTATLRATDGKPLRGYAIDITVTGAAGPQTFHGTTDTAGQYTIAYSNAFRVQGTDTITAKVVYTVPVGLAFKREGKQEIVLAGQCRQGSVSATATKIWIAARCGDGLKNQAGEQCDDGNIANGDGCDENCSPTRCGNGVVTAGEACDDGNTASGDGCDANCKPTACGNGIVTGAEQCDDGNRVDGDGCDNNCKTTRCGNGVVTAGEECDDGNTVSGDGCDANCTVTHCGNGVVTAGEECDDGNQISGDGCDANCTTTRCGNGVVTAGEQCDDGNAASGDGCDANCTTTRCGNGVVTAGEECDDGNQISGDGCDANCTAPRCGNGIVTAGEQCDDGNVVDGDGCDGNCTTTRCGNGVVTANEACDDGNTVSGDGCDANCTPTRCGNGVVTTSEACDDGNTVDGDGCDVNCTPTGCGNGIVSSGEECDDGNALDGDGCEADCTLARCGNGILDDDEQCDDGNQLDGDGCSATCERQEICSDLRDNDGDGLIDCDDPDCPPCQRIFNDPASITFGHDGPDLFKVHGGLAPLTAIDPVAEGIGILLTNGDGVIYQGVLPPGALQRRGDGAKFVDRGAAKGRGSHDGIYKITMLEKRGRYFIDIRIYADLSAATEPTMTLQLRIGDDAFFNKAAWRRAKSGWKLEF